VATLQDAILHTINVFEPRTKPLRIQGEVMIRNPSSRAVALGLRTWFSLLFLGLCSVSFGQTAVTGSINGSVSDSTGAVVPNATVTIKDTATGDTRVLTTNADLSVKRRLDTGFIGAERQLESGFGRAAAG
jgi:hypothetical protein